MAKVLFVCHVYPRHADDHQAAFMHDIARLAARRHEVLVLAPHDAGLPMEEVRDGVHIVRFRYASDVKETLAYRGDMHEQVLRRPARALLFARFLLAWRRALRTTLRTRRPDLVHVHWWIPGGLVARPICRRAGVPYVVSSHGTDVFLLRKAPPARRLARRVFGDAAGIHAVSSAVRGDIGRFISAEDAARTHVFTMPADLESLASLPRTPVPGRVLFVGRLIERKGAHVLIEAIRQLAARQHARATQGVGRDGRETADVEGGSGGAGDDGAAPHADAQGGATDLVPLSLHVVGEGPAHDALVAQAQQAHDAGVDVRILGAVSRSRLEQEYAQAHVFCLPSITTPRGEAEGLGVVLLEAMAVGVPVVGTRSGGIVDAVIDGETGLLVPEGDPAALAAAVQLLLHDETLAARLAAAARQRLPQRFGHDAIAARLAAWYAEVLA